MELEDTASALPVQDKPNQKVFAALVKERDELRQHALRLSALEEENRRSIQVLVKERDELQTYLKAAEQKLAHLAFPPGHFYSPIVDVRDPRVQAVFTNHESLDLPPTEDLTIDKELVREVLVAIAHFYKDLPFPVTKSAGFRYFYENPAFAYGDATVYFGLLRLLRPKKVIEIGVGYSSCVAMDTNDRFFGGKIELINIDPYPEVLLKLVPPTDRYLAGLRREPLQSVPTELFASLEENDILFIDSSHVGKLASDVNDYLFRILPALQSGVVVHIHDIPYPFEYALHEPQNAYHSWNETYLLRAFLQYNQAFKIIYFNHYVHRHLRDEVEKRMPNCLINCGASIWLKKL